MESFGSDVFQVPPTKPVKEETDYAVINTIPSTKAINKLAKYTEKNVEELRKLADDTTNDFNNLSEDYKKLEMRMHAANAVIVTVVIATFAIIALDYFKSRGEQYEKFVDKTQEIRNGYYSKEEVNTLMKDFKNCIWYNGLDKCLK